MTDSYLELFISQGFAENAQLSLLSIFFLFLARMLPIIALSPFFGARVLTNPVKVFLGIALFVIFLPSLLRSVSSPLLFNPQLVLLMLKEVFVGVIIGFFISIPYIIVQAAGMLIDHQRGGASLMVNDPTIQNQSSPIGLLFNMVLIYIFYQIDGPFLFLEAIERSYTVIPPDRFLNPVLFASNSLFWENMISLFNNVMVVVIQISAPALIAMLMTDLFLGIANRLAPQVQITFLGMPLKSMIGIALICFGWQFIVSEFAKQSYIWLQNAGDAMDVFQESATPTQEPATPIQGVSPLETEKLEPEKPEF